MIWNWPLGSTAREAKTAWPLALLNEPGTLALCMAEIGLDVRTGPWLSIGPGSPYL